LMKRALQTIYPGVCAAVDSVRGAASARRTSLPVTATPVGRRVEGAASSSRLDPHLISGRPAIPPDPR
jgi:hypothetical protein